MARASKDYSKGKVYMIRSKNENCVSYVGSTTKQYLSQRFEKHHSNYKQWKKNGKGFMSSFILFEKYDFKNCYIELLELCPCKISEELRKKEREWFDKLNCVNMDKPFISAEEKIEYDKIKYEKNKELLQEKAKIYRDKHKEKITKRGKKYRDEHKEEISNYKKEYTIKNKEIISEKAKETYDCPCGVICLKCNKTRHERSIKHQKYLTTIGTLCSTTVA